MSKPSVKADWRQSRSKRIKVAAAALLGKIVIRLLTCTLRLRTHPVARVDPYRKPGTGVIFAMFHGPHFPVLAGYKNQGLCVITSRSADGEILTRVLASFGYNTVRGSSSRGGMAAMKQLATVLKDGGDVAVAVDGPRGPRFGVKAGVILLAKRTGAPICPVGAGLSRCWTINSWDQYRIPKPFARGLVAGMTPMTVPPDIDDEQLEQLRAQLETQLVAHQNAVDEAVKQEQTSRAMLGEL